MSEPHLEPAHIEPSRPDAFWRCPGSPVSGDLATSRDAHAPGAEQLEALNRLVSQRMVPMQLSTDDIGTFQARVRSTSLGVVHLSDLWARNAVVGRRTSKLISSSDPPYLKVAVPVRGACVVSQGDQHATLGPGDFVLYDTTRPYQFSASASTHVQTVMFSRDILRLSPAQLQRLTTQRISGQEGLGFLVSQYLISLGQRLDTGVRYAAWHLAEATLDLLAASFAERLACTGTTELDSGKTGLLLRVQAYIEHRLGDPHLNVAGIAGAHYISIRTLQKLFEGQERTVTGWIRAQRLERCRRDLANPTLAEHPVASVAAHWGLVDAARFSRLFKSTFGLSPRDYRTKALAELRTAAM